MEYRMHGFQNPEQPDGGVAVYPHSKEELNPGKPWEVLCLVSPTTTARNLSQVVERLKVIRPQSPYGGFRALVSDQPEAGLMIEQVSVGFEVGLDVRLRPIGSTDPEFPHPLLPGWREVMAPYGIQPDQVWVAWYYRPDPQLVGNDWDQAQRMSRKVVNWLAWRVLELPGNAFLWPLSLKRPLWVGNTTDRSDSPLPSPL